MNESAGRRAEARPKLKSTRRRSWGIVLLTLGIGMLAAGLYQALTPALYEAAARVRAEEYTRAPDSVPGNPAHEPFFSPSQFEVLQSAAVLSNTVETLHLNRDWSGREAGGRTLDNPELVALLRQRLNLRRVPGTSLIEIRITSERPGEAARIANAVADAYHEYCLARDRQLVSNRLNAMEASFSEQQQKVWKAAAEVARRRRELGLPEDDSGTDGGASNVPPEKLLPLQRASNDLGRQQQALDELKTQMLTGNQDFPPNALPAEIVDRAEVSRHPVIPNRAWVTSLLLSAAVSSLAGLFLLGSGGKPRTPAR
jgi:hypothetical protein